MDYTAWSMEYWEEADRVQKRMDLIRQKMAKGKHLEKWEREFRRNNKKICDLKKRYTKEEQEEIDYWNKLLG